MKWAIYRIHYGIDYLKNSINSIQKDFDKIFIFYSEKPWIIKDKIKYKNQYINFPKNPENVKDYIIQNFNSSKFIIENYECDTPFNQFGNLFELAKKKLNIIPSKVLFMEPDMIFGSNQLSILNKELNLKFWINSLICRQIETWKYDNIKKNNNTYRIKLRKRRTGAVLWKINPKKPIIETEFSGAPQNKIKNFSAFINILNMGFSINKETMLYKHLLALAAYESINDSEPDEHWYENKWLNWNENVMDLDISKGSQSSIKQAFKYEIPYKFYQFLK